MESLLEAALGESLLESLLEYVLEESFCKERLSRMSPYTDSNAPFENPYVRNLGEVRIPLRNTDKDSSIDPNTDFHKKSSNTDFNKDSKQNSNTNSKKDSSNTDSNKDSNTDSN